MSFNQSEHIGRPAPGVKKWKQPPGTSYYRFSMSQSNGFTLFLLRNEDFADDGSNVIRLKSPSTVFNSNNCIILLDEIFRKYASRSWSSPPASPSVDSEVLLLERLSGSTESVSSPLVESADCDSGIEISTARIGKRIYKYNSSDFPPQMRVRATEDNPTIETICTRQAKISGNILLPNDGISSTPGATSYPNLSLTLIKKT